MGTNVSETMFLETHDSSISSMRTTQATGPSQNMVLLQLLFSKELVPIKWHVLWVKIHHRKGQLLFNLSAWWQEGSICCSSTPSIWSKIFIDSWHAWVLSIIEQLSGRELQLRWHNHSQWLAETSGTFAPSEKLAAYRPDEGSLYRPGLLCCIWKVSQTPSNIPPGA